MKVIAESAFNHNGDFNYLKDLALASKNSGADFFTVQVMNVDAFCVRESERYELSKKTEFQKEQWLQLFDYCKEINIDVIPCVLEEHSFLFCYKYGFRLIKIHATDITNQPFLELIKSKDDVRVILETQCATLFEVKFALNILRENSIEALFTGFSNYPTEVEDLNLNVIDYFRKHFKYKTGYADHSLDTANIPLMALAKGCEYLEKHITLSRNDRNPDYQLSLYPNEFASMVANIKHYTSALGNGIKHPVENERKYRNVMYKKVLESEITLKRADKGEYYLDKLIDSFDKNNIVVALIARLKSQRLKEKVLKPFHSNEMIVDLYNRLSLLNNAKIFLATSYLHEDGKLVEIFKQKGFNYFKGDPVSVIDRMLDLAFKEKAGCIFRVTGDNPFTDPYLMEEMIKLMQKNNLDYVKVNNAPIGIGAELFSTQYLWRLYLNLKTTEFSEYLSWYVLNDESARMGCIDIESDNKYGLINLSVDLKEDYDRCIKILGAINKSNFKDITLNDIFSTLKGIEQIDDTRPIKLPGGNTILLSEYFKKSENKKYIVRKLIMI